MGILVGRLCWRMAREWKGSEGIKTPGEGEPHAFRGGESAASLGPPAPAPLAWSTTRVERSGCGQSLCCRVHPSAFLRYCFYSLSRLISPSVPDGSPRS